MSATNGGDKIDQQKTNQRGGRTSIKGEQTRNKLNDCPPTKDGYRYCLCEDDPLCKNYIAELDKNFTEVGRRPHIMPSFIKRKAILPIVRLSESDRAQQLKLNDDCMRVMGEKGYCMVRATHCINRDKWYYEATIDSMQGGSAARIGWAQRYANLQAPLGYDSYGYSYRSRLGTKFHEAKGYTFDKGGGYDQGDTIGCMIDLPYGNENNITEARHLSESLKKSALVVLDRKKKDSGRIFEEKEEIPSKLTPCKGSKISFYKNGKYIGTAFHDINEGFYFPTISLYKGAAVTVNFGPNFKYPPEMNPDNNNLDGVHMGYRDVQQLPLLESIDATVTDLVYLVDQEEDLKESFNKCIDGSKAEKI